MTKADLTEEISRVVEITPKEAEGVAETILASIVEGLRDGTGVEIRGFGSFRTRQRAGRIGRNPKTGEASQDDRLLQAEQRAAGAGEREGV